MKEHTQPIVTETDGRYYHSGCVEGWREVEAGSETLALVRGP